MLPQPVSATGALPEDLEEEFRSGGGQGHEAQLVDVSGPRRDRFRCRLSSRLSSRVSSGPLYLVFTGATPQRGSPAREAARAYCGDMTTWSVAGGTSPRASLSM